MAIIKCKMCGGTIEFEPGASVGVCEYCGSKQTLPRLDDDRRANLYDRANHFRRNNEFDKAAGIYEQILNEDTSDAEAYWSLVLCRYGIEYVEDPATHKRVPTVNRAQFTSIFDDDNYKSALRYADGFQRSIYQEEAAAINEIQKGILAISQKEEPFDVFICYKETDNSGRRTRDSVLANELYHQLTQEGFKVFFSRITLEDKLGTAYEPYIFAALNSAKVMVVLGTRPEYFNAVWVKNEWSRYLALVKQSGGKKVLIPAYRDMDPYDLPEEFSHLQAQDMSKLGFMQDLIRGVKKIVRADEAKPAVRETVVVNATANANTAPLLKRAFMFLEDGEWAKADDFCEQVLNLEPENAQAYLGKLMAELHVRRQEDLPNCERPFDRSSSYQKALRFGDEKLAGTLRGYITHIKERNENDRLTGIYTRATEAMNAANSEAAYQYAASTFKSIPGFKDADARAAQCLAQAEVCSKDAVYAFARSQMTGNVVSKYEAAISNFRTISGWKDADEQIDICRRKIEEIKAKEEVDRLERERQDEQRRVAAEKAAKKRKKIAAIVIPIVVACIAFVIVLTKVIIPNSKYNKAVKLYEAGKYEEAITAFEALDGYKDSAEKLSESKYNKAVKLYEAGKYEEAIVAFEALDGYKDSKEQITRCETAILDRRYDEAVKLYEAGKYEEAIAAFEALDGYKDSVEKMYEIRHSAEWMKLCPVGESLFFGYYEQDNNTSKGKEDIEWVVLAKESSRILVISKYALDCKPYNTTWTDVTWETCSLRKWLNHEFLNAAFTAEERKLIPTVTVSADKNPNYSTNPGQATQDKVFLLSVPEVNKYFKSDEARKCVPTDYAVAQGPYTCDSEKAACRWWLRSPGYNSNYAASVIYNCSVLYYGDVVIYDGFVDGDAVTNDDAVRPALWINLEP